MIMVSSAPTHCVSNMSDSFYSQRSSIDSEYYESDQIDSDTASDVSSPFWDHLGSDTSDTPYHSFATKGEMTEDLVSSIRTIRSKS